jgi:hypothetical protein
MSIQIDLPSLKKSHCSIGLQNNVLWIENLNFGTDTTFLNHKKVAWLERIYPGMQISLGGSDVTDPNIFVGILHKDTSGSGIKKCMQKRTTKSPI